MSLGRNKKGIEWSTLIEILLLIVAASLIITVFITAAGRADEKSAENLCRGFNALRYATKADAGVVSFNIAPRACRTIDKKDVPSKDYKNNIDGTKEAAESEIRDLMARCWWMWLEGNQQNMFDAGWYDTKNGCFICYTFSVSKDSGYTSYDDFSLSLSKPYYAVDATDRCAAGGGGKCTNSCDETFSEEVSSSKCNPQESGFIEAGEKIIKATSTDKSATPADSETSTGVPTRKCCVSKNECENKGGKCMYDPDQTYSLYYKNWQCNKGKCFIKSDKMASYLDYIQGTNGVNGGAGKVLFAGNDGFKSGTKYAITFVSPGKTADLGTVGTIFAAAGSAAVGVATIVLTGGLSIPVYIVGGAALASTGYYGLSAWNSGHVNDLNYVMISKYDMVKDKCAVEAGAGEK